MHMLCLRAVKTSTKVRRRRNRPARLAWIHTSVFDGIFLRLASDRPAVLLDEERFGIGAKSLYSRARASWARRRRDSRRTSDGRRSDEDVPGPRATNDVLTSRCSPLNRYGTAVGGHRGLDESAAVKMRPT